ncbi:Glucitol operon repressor [Anaerolineae bacterium]|nr:Glucitol operon repressor [Anaerolineae bacterium]
MTSFERRQRVLDVMQKQPGIRVPEVARLLSVSEGTVRNDLRALAADGQLKRVRGGAVIEPHRSEAPAFAARASVHAAAKQNMARYAAELVQDGDSIVCDASSTVYHLARYLRDRRNLTIITNGVELARNLATNANHTVILLGGELRSDGAAVSGPIAERALEDLRVKTAFLSATGLSPDSGLYEVDIHEAQLKRKMITAASSIVALIDASKLGKVDLTLFARLDQISQLYVDDSLLPDWQAALHAAAAPLTICGADNTISYPRESS